MYYSVIIPVFNGETTVEVLYEKLASFFQSHGYKFEVIFVYDCGKDNSWSVLEKLKRQNTGNIKIIKLTRNYGQHNALICGFEYASGDFLVTMDEDLQHEPNDILNLIIKQQEANYDVIYGKYEVRKHSFFDRATSSLLKSLIKIGIPEIYPDYSPFRLIKSSIAKSTVSMRNSYTFLDGYLSWITANMSSCLVTHYERQGGVSAYTIKKKVNHAINIFVTFSNFPIRILTKLSFLVLFMMFGFTVYVIVRKIIYDDFALGYPSIILAIGFGIGLIMLSFGIIGEYIYRINLKTTKRPNYNVDTIL